MIPRHTADSMLFAAVRRPAIGEHWADVGSGAGFPGVVLAICFPETSFALIEPQRRRAGFLDSVVAELGLANVDISMSSAEQMVPGFDVAVARALARPAAALPQLLKLLLPGGQAIVATAAGSASIDGAQLVRFDDLGDVDSPGVFSMMTRES